MYLKSKDYFRKSKDIYTFIMDYFYLKEKEPIRINKKNATA